MKKIAKIVCVFWIVTSASMACAQKKELVIGMGNFEPYFIAKEESGLFMDLIKEIFQQLPQYTLKFRFDLPVKRMLQEFEEGRFDGAANVFAGHDVHGCKSDPMFRFQDVAVTLKDKHFTITKIADLTGRRIVAYQGAKTFLGEAFKTMADANPFYSETAQPHLQARMLATGRVDVSIGDIYIFLYNLKEWSNGQVSPEQFEVHELFPAMYTSIAFKEQQVCDDVNRALQEIKADGRYEAVYQRYLHLFGYQVHDRTP